jgi:DNA-damage-inducible protein J
MAKTANLNIRLDPKLKSRVENLYSSYGLTLSDAVNIFFHKSLMVGGLPFAVRQDFNNETIEAMEDVRQRRNLHGPYKTAKETIKAMLAD